jgi:pSer/pThr/pTyr-binding forkhead associated (FHA) protein
MTEVFMSAANNLSQDSTQSLRNPLLRTISNNSSSANEHILIKPETSIGRDSKCDISISEDLVSSYHFQVEERRGLYYLVHPHPLRAQTLNGFSYQGKQYRGNEQFDQLNNGLHHL